MFCSIPELPSPVGQCSTAPQPLLTALSELAPGGIIPLCVEQFVTDFKVIPGVFTAQLFLTKKLKIIYFNLSLVSLGRQQPTLFPPFCL